MGWLVHQQAWLRHIVQNLCVWLFQNEEFELRLNQPYLSAFGLFGLALSVGVTLGM